MEITELARENFIPIPIGPGDGFQLTYIDENGDEHVTATHIFEGCSQIDTAVIFKADEMLGMKNVIGGAFGES